MMKKKNQRQVKVDPIRVLRIWAYVHKHYDLFMLLRGDMTIKQYVARCKKFEREQLAKEEKEPVEAKAEYETKTAAFTSKFGPDSAYNNILQMPIDSATRGIVRAKENLKLLDKIRVKD